MSSKSQNDTPPKCPNDTQKIKTLEFISAYEKEECLWNPSMDNYKNKSARDEAYENIIHELKDSSLSIKDIKLKVKSVRTTYTKELRLQMKRKGSSKPYCPKLFWFSRADSFLKNVSLSRNKRNSATTSKTQPIVKEEQLCNTSISTQVDGPTLVDYNMRLAVPGHVEVINDIRIDDKNTQCKTKNQQQHHHQHTQTQLEEMHEDEPKFIQHQQPQQQQQQQTQIQLDEMHADASKFIQQQQSQQQHDVLMKIDNPICISIPSPPTPPAPLTPRTISTSSIITTTTTENIMDNDEIRNCVSGSDSEHEHEVYCVTHVMESPRQLPTKTDNTSQNPEFIYCTNDTNNSSNMLATNIDTTTINEHNIGDINGTGHQNFNNATSYVDSSDPDNCDIFCRSVAAQLRHVSDPYSRSFAKFKIQEILFEAETGRYRLNDKQKSS